MMEEDDDVLLLAFALGTATVEERAAVLRSLDAEPALAARLEALDTGVAALGAGLGPPAGPWSQLSKRLSGAGRLEHLVPALAELFDLSHPAATALTAQFDDDGAWHDGPAPGVRVLLVETGPRWSGFVATCLRLEPGAQLPTHTHGAEERVLVLEGGYRDDPSGEEFWRGDLDVRAAGTSHSFTALPGLGCLCASVTAFADDDA